MLLLYPSPSITSTPVVLELTIRLVGPRRGDSEEHTLGLSISGYSVSSRQFIGKESIIASVHSCTRLPVVAHGSIHLPPLINIIYVLYVLSTIVYE